MNADIGQEGIFLGDYNRGRINAIYYWDNILHNHIIPFFHQHQDMHKVFQQDNARTHIACVTTQYLANSYVPLLNGQDCPFVEWPGLSPDLSPIKHLWNYLGQCISRHPKMITLNNWKTYYSRSGMLSSRILFADLTG